MLPVKGMDATVDEAQTTVLTTVLTVGFGSTVIVNEVGVPVQVTPAFVYDGVTVIVPEIGVMPALVAVKLVMSPVPLAARPIAVLVFVQLYTVPGTLPLNDTVVVALALQTVWFETLFTVGTVLTVTACELAVAAVQPLASV
jgi:hypothetical protein